MLVLGLMSGTSADGVDAVIAQFEGAPNRPKWKLLNIASIPYPKGLRETIVNVGQGLKLTCKQFIELAESITETHVHAARACDPKRVAQLVGCHGQTIWHRPPSNKQLGVSWQMLQASLMAQLLNTPVVHDFRAADLALGGQGAPLVPLLDAALLGRISSWRGVLNIGGLSNISLIPPDIGPDRCAAILGWDCGPGNSLIDLLAQRISGGQLSCDFDGSIAALGSPDLRIIAKWLQEPFFKQSPPKSTGREQFGIDDLDRRTNQLPDLSNECLMATLTTFSAAAIAQDLDNLQSRNFVRPTDLLVAGGGLFNPVMMQELKSRCHGIRVMSIDEFGIPSKAREALAFALLAWWHILEYPGNSPVITGANKSAVLGVMAHPA